MNKKRTVSLIALSFAVLGMAAALGVGAQDYVSSRSGIIDTIAKVKGVITLSVTIEDELAQPSNPQLSTGVPDPSKVTSFTNGSTRVVTGMPVALVIVSRGATFTPVIGAVESVVDAGHCLVRVDSAALEKTWQDPADPGTPRKVGEYLKEGAAVSIVGVTNQ